MATYRHPRAGEDTPGHPPNRIHVSRADKRAVDEDGVFEAPRRIARAIAARHDTTAEAMRVDDTDGSADGTVDTSDGDDDADSGECEVILTSGEREGEPCGRELPCRFHSEED